MIRTTGKKREEPGPSREGPEGSQDHEGDQDEGGAVERDGGGGEDRASARSGGVEEGELVLEEMEALQDEMDRMKDQHLRLAADFENYRKRVNAELSESWVRAQADLTKRLVETLDDLERVSRFTSEDASVDVLVEGVDLVERKLLKALGEAGLEVLDPMGEVFDPNSMEAVMIVATEKDGEEGKVHQVLQKGYAFKDQLVRPARVSVLMKDA
jgi:molecular chaperone GrpE